MKNYQITYVEPKAETVKAVQKGSYIVRIDRHYAIVYDLPKKDADVVVEKLNATFKEITKFLKSKGIKQLKVKPLKT